MPNDPASAAPFSGVGYRRRVGRSTHPAPFRNRFKQPLNSLTFCRHKTGIPMMLICVSKMFSEITCASVIRISWPGRTRGPPAFGPASQARRGNLAEGAAEGLPATAVPEPLERSNSGPRSRLASQHGPPHAGRVPSATASGANLHV
jgi:hypothetical protein